MSMTKADTPAKIVRTRDLVYRKALALRNLLADVDADWQNATLLMDRWTHENFMGNDRALRDFSLRKGRPTWADLDIEVHYYQPPLSLRPYTDEIPVAAISLNDDPFLMSIRYQKRENKRIVYIDDPDLHSHWR
jgi:hypothetical protein